MSEAFMRRAVQVACIVAIVVLCIHGGSDDE